MSVEIHDEIVRLYETGEFSQQDLAKKFGYSLRTIQAIICRAGVKLPVKKKQKPGRRPLEDTPPISSLHEQIGREMSFKRHFNLRLTQREASPTFRMSVHRIIAAEQGKHDFTLSELQHLASVLGVSLVDLVRERPSVVYAPVPAVRRGAVHAQH